MRALSLSLSHLIANDNIVAGMELHRCVAVCAQMEEEDGRTLDAGAIELIALAARVVDGAGGVDEELEHRRAHIEQGGARWHEIDETPVRVDTARIVGGGGQRDRRQHR